VFHVELRKFPNVARTFNLSEAQLNAKILVPWTRGEVVLLGEREWEPADAKLTVLEGRELRSDEMGMGRGWQNAGRGAEDVTERVLAAVRARAKPAATPAVGAEAGDAAAAFKQVVRAQCATDRLAVHQVMWLANSRHPEWRVSERLALAERAVWELLHEGSLVMEKRVPGDDYAPADRTEWGPALLAWATWSDSAPSRWYVVAAPE